MMEVRPMGEAGTPDEALDGWVAPAVHADAPIAPDPPHEVDLAAHLKATETPAALAGLYGRFIAGPGSFDGMMRRVIWRALAAGFGDGVRIAPLAAFRHLERVSIGDGVFIGEGAMIQGHALGRCVIGERAWIGPGAFLDARALVLERAAAVGPGAKILTAEHTGDPPGAPVMATDQAVAGVRIGEGADIGVGAIVLPGRSIGRGAIVGAGAVVTNDVPDGAVVAGSPARVLRFRA
jgi:acetyltransferase-like isoleucine patch superfamily enzyme